MNKTVNATSQIPVNVDLTYQLWTTSFLWRNSVRCTISYNSYIDQVVTHCLPATIRHEYTAVSAFRTSPSDFLLSAPAGPLGKL